MDKTKSALWHSWQAVIRDAGKLDHNSSQAYEILGRDMAMEMHAAAVIAAEVGANCQNASLAALDELEEVKGMALCDYFDPRTPAQRDADQHDAECQATDKGL